MQTIFYIINLLVISKFFCREKEEYNISYFDKSSIETINDYNFDEIINKGITNDYIILFTIKICEGCDQVLKVLEKAKEFYSKKDSNITFYKINLSESVEIDLRFNFDEIPIIIYVSKDKYAKYPFKYVSIDHIKNFIEDKNKAMIDLPKELGFFDYFIKTFELIVDCIMLKCPILKKNYYHYWVLIIGFIAWIIILSIYVFIKFFCINSNKRKKNSLPGKIKKKNKTKSKIIFY